MIDPKKLCKDPELAKTICTQLPAFLKTFRLAYAALAAPTDQKMLRAKKALETSTKVLEDLGCDEE
jgi:hypothetical protein